mmetsp:Transcript_29304/g.69588  ORF Transcript_29304/g.69588 Transcript_29304/m.69588 type:complete len:114 (-) Transcript_29304:1213-1554(-)
MPSHTTCIPAYDSSLYSAGRRVFTNHGRFQPSSPLVLGWLGWLGWLETPGARVPSVTRALRTASAEPACARTRPLRIVVSSSQYTQCPQCKESDAARRGDVQPDWNDALSSPS